jgi:RNA polymerase sigma-70 factor, ECF subfamily
MKKNELFMSEFYPHLPALYRSAFKLTWNQVDAEELVAKTVERVLASMDSYKQEDKPLAFMRTVARNIFLNDCKKIKVRKTQLVDDEAFLQYDAAEEAQLLDTFANLLNHYDSFSDEVIAALARLKNDDHNKIFFAFMDGHKSAEIAKSVKSNENTVKGIVRRVRITLIPELAKYAYETYGIVADIKMEKQQPFEA